MEAAVAGGAQSAMILTCPRCAARYVVGEDQVGPQGRKVKCTTCGQIWLATKETDFDIPADPYLVAPPEPEEAEKVPEPVSAAAKPPPQEELRQRMRARARLQGEQGRVILWSGVVALVVTTVAVVAFYREIAQALDVALQ